MPRDAFRELLRSLPGHIDEQRQAGLPVVLEVTEPLPAHAQRLMETLGVEVRVVTPAPVSVVTHCSKIRCSWNFVGDPARARVKLREHEALMHGAEISGREPSAEDRAVPQPSTVAQAAVTPDKLASRPEPSITSEGTRMQCKIDGCHGDASGAPKAGTHARLCAKHRDERSAEMSKQRKGRPRGSIAAIPSAAPRLRQVAVNGSLVARATALLDAARAVDDAEAALTQARDDLAAIVKEFGEL